MIEYFSKFGWVVTMQNKNSQSIIDAIKLWFALHVKWDSFQSNNGTEFVNAILKTY